jgi:hypothetical protein
MGSEDPPHARSPLEELRPFIGPWAESELVQLT